MNLLRERDQITYRAPLALHFTDAVTRQPIRDGLDVIAWPYLEGIAGAATPVRQIVAAEKSPQSALYGFHSLPGLEGYQIGDDVTPGAHAYIIQVTDRLARFLPQTLRIDLPSNPLAAQEVPLFPAPNRATPTGYGTVRGQLLRTTTPMGVPPEITVAEPARWAAITLTIGGEDVQTFTDAQGLFVAMVPYPAIAADTLLTAAEWAMTFAVAHSPGAIAGDLDALTIRRPTLDRATTPPLQRTLLVQSGATLFAAVTVVDAAVGHYAVIGATNVDTVDVQLRFGEPLLIRTQIDGGPQQLSEFLIHSA